MENNSGAKGLKAIEGLGNFILFGSLAVIGIIALVIGIIINIVHSRS